MNIGKCSQPWFEMQIQYDTQVRPCCYYAENLYAWDFSYSVDIAALWNSNPFKVTRAIIANDMNEGSPCSACQFVRYADKPSFLDIDESANELQRSNWATAIRNYESKTLVIESTPVKFYFNFGLSCNLSCVMCCQMDQRGIDSRTIPVDRLIELKEYLVRANEIVVIGGEPLVIPQARAFIEHITADPDFSNIKLTILTNATLLDRFMPQLRTMRRLNLMISLDSIGEAYEQIRQGANWDQTSRNVLAFKQESLNHNGLWNITVSSIIMKSSIPRLADFSQWCIANEIPIWFGPLVDYSFTELENVFKYPEILDELPGWEQQFDEAIALLEHKGWTEKGSAPLQLMKKQLTEAWNEKCGQFQTKQSLRDILYFSSQEPLVSLVMRVKNDLPYLPQAVASVMSQTYRNFELVVQDGASTDGSLEYLRQLETLPCVDVQSTPDKNREDAMRLAFKRCRGEIIGSIDADSLLEKDALRIAVQSFLEHPECAVIYGSYNIISDQGTVLGISIPPVIDRLGLIECDVDIPLAASFFSRKHCDSEWLKDGERATHTDFDFWLQLLDKPILRVDTVFGNKRLRRNGTSCNAETYDQICKDRIFAVDNYLDTISSGPAKEWLRRRAYAGIYAWAAESLLKKSAALSDVKKFMELSRQHDPGSIRLLKLSDNITRSSS